MTVYIVMYRDDPDDEGMYIDSGFTNRSKAADRMWEKMNELGVGLDDGCVCIEQCEICE